MVDQQAKVRRILEFNTGMVDADQRCIAVFIGAFEFGITGIEARIVIEM